MPSSPSPPPSPGALSSPPDIYLAALAGDAGLCAALLLRDGPSAPLANAQLVAPSAPLLERRRLIKLILRAMVRSAGWSGPGVTPAQLLFMSRKLEFALFHTHTPYVRGGVFAELPSRLIDRFLLRLLLEKASERRGADRASAPHMHPATSYA